MVGRPNLLTRHTHTLLSAYATHTRCCRVFTSLQVHGYSELNLNKRVLFPNQRFAPVISDEWIEARRSVRVGSGEWGVVGQENVGRKEQDQAVCLGDRSVGRPAGRPRSVARAASRAVVGFGRTVPRRRDASLKSTLSLSLSLSLASGRRRSLLDRLAPAAAVATHASRVLPLVGRVHRGDGARDHVPQRLQHRPGGAERAEQDPADRDRVPEHDDRLVPHRHRARGVARRPRRVSVPPHTNTTYPTTYKSCIQICPHDITCEHDLDIIHTSRERDSAAAMVSYTRRERERDSAAATVTSASQWLRGLHPPILTCHTRGIYLDSRTTS